MTCKILIAALVGAFFVSGCAVAQTRPPPCAPHEDVADTLETGYGELPVWRGLTDDGNMIEAFAAPGGSTWTLIVTFPNGLSCPMGAGKAWWDAQPRPKKTGLKI